jgi:hypothetical protein
MGPRFEVFTAMKIQSIIIWVVTSCNDVMEHGFTTQKTATVIPAFEKLDTSHSVLHLE